MRALRQSGDRWSGRDGVDIVVGVSMGRTNGGVHGCEGFI